MGFTYNLSTQVGKLRLRIGDTKPFHGPRPHEDANGDEDPYDGSNFTDEELTSCVTEEGNVDRASARIFEILAAEWAVFVNITLGPRREELSRIADKYADLAKAARAQYGGSPSSAASGFSVGWSRQDGYSESAAQAAVEWGLHES